MKAESSVLYDWGGSNFINSIASSLNSGWTLIFRHAKNDADH